MTADFPDYQVPQAHADRIAATGVPLLNLPRQVFNRQAATLAAGAFFQTATAAISQPGYDVFFQVSENVAGAASAQVTVALNWFDSATNLAVQSEVYNIFIPAAGGGAHLVRGFGPTRGDQLNIVITNNDTQAITYSLVVTQNSRPALVGKWITHSTGTPTGITNANFDSETLVIAQSGPSVGAGSSLVRGCAFGVGRAHLRASCATQPFRVQVSAFDPALAGGSVVIASAGSTAAANGQSDVDFYLPRSQCQITLFNDGAAAAAVTAAITLEDQ